MRGLEWSRSREILLDLLASEAAWKAIKAYNARASKCLASPSLAGKPADPCSVHVHKRFACTRWPKNALGSFVANVSMTLDLKQIARGRTREKRAKRFWLRPGRTYSVCFMDKVLMQTPKRWTIM